MPGPISCGRLGDSRDRKLAKMNWQKIAYGALFVFIVPALLCAWAATAYVAMPVYGSLPVGIAFVCAGLVLMLVAMFELWHFGGGLPMNAFPPPAMVPRRACG
jgi:fatty acid desaturase